MTMSDIDNIIEKNGQSPKSDGESWKTKKRNERNEVFKAANDTATLAVSCEKEFTKYLDTQSRFDKYSATNVLLIMAQRPDATQLRDFGSWKDAGFQVQKNEKGIKILEPSGEYTDREGNVRQNFNVKSVFDISQTDAKAKDERPGHEPKELLKALIYRRPVQISMTNGLDRGRGAFYDHERKMLFVVRGQSDPELFRNVSLELALAEFAIDGNDYEREKREFSACCVSYMLCRKHGIDTKSFDFSRVSENFIGLEPSRIWAKLTEIRDVAETITERMNVILYPEKVPIQKEEER